MEVCKMKKISLEQKINMVLSFGDKLLTQWDSILYNGADAITAKDTSLLEFIAYDLEDSDIVKSNSDSSLTIITKNETITLTGVKKMSDGEIYLRNFLAKNDCTGSLIIRDRLDQVEIEEKNIFNIENLFSKCKDVINIRKVPEDSEHYNMNWDCLLVRFKGQDNEEIWQPA
jgi:hypothetical protein